MNLQQIVDDTIELQWNVNLLFHLMYKTIWAESMTDVGICFPNADRA